MPILPTLACSDLVSGGEEAFPHYAKSSGLELPSHKSQKVLAGLGAEKLKRPTALRMESQGKAEVF